MKLRQVNVIDYEPCIHTSSMVYEANSQLGLDEGLRRSQTKAEIKTCRKKNSGNGVFSKPLAW